MRPISVYRFSKIVLILFIRLLTLDRYWAARNTWWRSTLSARSPACWKISWLSNKPFWYSGTRTLSLLRFLAFDNWRNLLLIFFATTQVASDAVYPLLEKTSQLSKSNVGRKPSMNRKGKPFGSSMELTSSWDMEGLYIIMLWGQIWSHPLQRSWWLKLAVWNCGLLEETSWSTRFLQLLCPTVLRRALQRMAK